MSTQSRLDAYYAAELRILARGQSVGFAQRQQALAELAEVRKAIAALESELRGAQSTAAGGGSLSFATVDFRTGR